MAYTLPTPTGSKIAFEDDVSIEEAQNYIDKRYGTGQFAPPKELESSVVGDTLASLQSGLGSLVEFGGNIYGLATGEFDNVGTRIGGGLRDIAREELASEEFKAQRDEVEAELAKLEGQGIGKEVVGTLGKIATDPYYMFQLGIEQIPNLVTGLGVGTVAKKGVEKLAKEAAENTAKKVGKLSKGDKAGRAASIGTFAAMQGADVAKSTYDEIEALPDAKFAEMPEFQDLLNQGMSPREARKQIAGEKAGEAFRRAGLLSVVTAGLLPSSLEKTVFGGTTSGFLKGAGKTGLQEGLQEAAEEGGGALIRGLGVQDVDPTRDVTEGVGVAGTLGGALGFGLGAGVGGLGGYQIARAEDQAKRDEERRERIQQQVAEKEAKENIKKQAEESQKFRMGEPDPEAERRTGPRDVEEVQEDVLTQEEQEAISAELAEAQQTGTQAEEKVDGDAKTRTKRGRDKQSVGVSDESGGELSGTETEESVGGTTGPSDGDIEGGDRTPSVTDKRDDSKPDTTLKQEKIKVTDKKKAKEEAELLSIKNAYDNVIEEESPYSKESQVLRGIAFDIAENTTSKFYEEEELPNLEQRQADSGQGELFSPDKLRKKVEGVSQFLGAKNAKKLLAVMPQDQQEKVNAFVAEFTENKRRSKDVIQRNKQADKEKDKQRILEIEDLEKELETTKDPEKRQTIIDLINQKEKNIAEDKRLDAETVGGQQSIFDQQENSNATKNENKKDAETKSILETFSANFKAKFTNSELYGQENKKKEKEDGTSQSLFEVISAEGKQSTATKRTISKLREMVRDTEYEGILEGFTGKLNDSNVKISIKEDLTSEAITEYNPKTGKSKIFVRSDITPETLLHELTHAATINRVHTGKLQAQLNINSPLSRTYKSLEKLLEQLQVYVTSEKESTSSLVQKLRNSAKNGFKDTPLENVDELIAYGFTNREFQSLLKLINIESDLGLGVKVGELEVRGKKGFAKEDASQQMKKGVTKAVYDAFHTFVSLVERALNLPTIRKLAGPEGTKANELYNINVLKYLTSQTGNLIAYNVNKKDRVEIADKIDLLKDTEKVIYDDLLKEIEPVTRKLVGKKRQKFIVDAEGKQHFIDSTQDSTEQTTAHSGNILKRFFNPSSPFGPTLTEVINKFANSRIRIKQWEEKAERDGKLNLGAGFNNVYTKITTAMGRAEDKYSYDVKPLEQELSDIIAEMKQVFGDMSSGDMMQHLSNVLIAYHDAERRRIKFIRKVRFDSKASTALRGQIIEAIYSGKDLNGQPITKASAQAMRQQLETLVNNDPKASATDMNSDDFQVSHLTGLEAQEIIQRNQDLMNNNPKYKQTFELLQDWMQRIEQKNVEINKEANFWTDSVEGIKDFYGWKNYIPLKGRDQSDDDLNFTSRRLGGELQDTQDAFTGRNSIGDNVIVRSLTEAAHATLKEARMDTTQAIKNAVLDGSMEGEIANIPFEDKPKNLQKNIKPNVILHYNSDGSVDAITLKDKELAESIRSSGREVHQIFEYMNAVTSKLGQLHTRYNVNFPALNYIRDLMTNSFILGAEFSPKESYRLLRDVSQKTHVAMPIVWAFSRRANFKDANVAREFIDKNAKTPSQKQFMNDLLEYLSSGGKISYIRSLSTDNELRALMNKVPMSGTKNKTLQQLETGAKASGDLLNKAADTWMDTFELTARVIMYSRVKKLMHEQNMARAETPQFIPELADINGKAMQEKATAYVKNLANFEQSGTKGRTIGSFYMFFRPSMTGAVRSLEALMKGKYGKEMGGILLGMGAFLYAIAAGFSADDEEGRNSVLNDDLSRWTRYFRMHLGENFVLQVPWGFGNGGLMAVGSQLMGLFMGNNSIAEVAENITRIFSESYVPLPISGISPLENSPVLFALDSMLPSAVRPLVQHVNGINGLGYQIYSSSNSRYSEAYGFSPNIPDYFNEVSRYIFDGTNGAIDMSPNEIYFFLNAYFDGPSRLIGQVDGLAKLATGDKHFNPKSDAPLIGSFFSKPSNIDGKQFAMLRKDMTDFQKRYNVAKTDPRRLREFIKENRDNVSALFAYNKMINGSLRKHQALKNRIIRDPKLSPKERQDKLDKVKDLINADKRRIMEIIEKRLD